MEKVKTKSVKKREKERKEKKTAAFLLISANNCGLVYFNHTPSVKPTQPHTSSLLPHLEMSYLLR